MRGRAAAIATVMLVGLVVLTPQRSMAALCARWDSPAPGVAGEPLAITFETFAPISTGGDEYRLEPHPFTDYPFRVVAVSPDGDEVKGRVEPAGDIRWTGTVTPTSPGRWTVRIINLHGSDPECYEDAFMQVAEPPRSWTSVIVIALALAAALGAVTVLVLGRRRSRSGGR
jgi:hypothetical protein